MSKRIRETTAIILSAALVLAFSLVVAVTHNGGMNVAHAASMPDANGTSSYNTGNPNDFTITYSGYRDATSGTKGGSTKNIYIYAGDTLTISDRFVLSGSTVQNNNIGMCLIEGGTQGISGLTKCGTYKNMLTNVSAHSGTIKYSYKPTQAGSYRFAAGVYGTKWFYTDYFTVTVYNKPVAPTFSANWLSTTLKAGQNYNSTYAYSYVQSKPFAAPKVEYTTNLSDNALPKGIQRSGATLIGTPTYAGTYAITATISMSGADTLGKEYKLGPISTTATITVTSTNSPQSINLDPKNKLTDDTLTHCVESDGSACPAYKRLSYNSMLGKEEPTKVDLGAVVLDEYQNKIENPDVLYTSSVIDDAISHDGSLTLGKTSGTRLITANVQGTNLSVSTKIVSQSAPVVDNIIEDLRYGVAKNIPIKMDAYPLPQDSSSFSCMIRPQGVGLSAVVFDPANSQIVTDGSLNSGEYMWSGCSVKVKYLGDTYYSDSGPVFEINLNVVKELEPKINFAVLSQDVSINKEVSFSCSATNELDTSVINDCAFMSISSNDQNDKINNSVLLPTSSGTRTLTASACIPSSVFQGCNPASTSIEVSVNQLPKASNVYVTGKQKKYVSKSLSYLAYPENVQTQCRNLPAGLSVVDNVISGYPTSYGYSVASCQGGNSYGKGEWFLVNLDIEKEALAYSFNDVSPKSAFYNDIVWMYQSGFTNGCTSSKYCPAGTVSRAEMAAFLYRLAGSPSVSYSSSKFSDVASGVYYFNAVYWLRDKGITNGVGGNKFSPKSSVTRGQMVQFLYRLAGQPYLSNVNTSPFKDVSTKDYYYKGVCWAKQVGVTKGVSKTSFSPNTSVKRDQMAAFVHRYANMF